MNTIKKIIEVIRKYATGAHCKIYHKIDLWRVDHGCYFPPEDGLDIRNVKSWDEL